MYFLQCSHYPLGSAGPIQVVGMPNSVDRLVHKNDFLARQFFRPFSGNNDCKKEEPGDAVYTLRTIVVKRI